MDHAATVPAASARHPTMLLEPPPAAAAGAHPAPGRKIRSDAKLEHLSPEQQERLRFWLEDENRSYVEVARRVLAEFGVSVGKSAVASYWQRRLLPERHEEEAEVAAPLAALPVGDVDAATLTQARMFAFSELTQPCPQAKSAARMLDVVHRADRLALARQRVALEERRVALREAAAVGPVPSASARHQTQVVPGRRVERAEAAAGPEQAALTRRVERAAPASKTLSHVEGLFQNFSRSPRDIRAIPG